MEGIKYTEIMGPNVLDKLKYCGKDVKIYDLAKICNPQWAEIDDKCMIFDYAFIDARGGLKVGKCSIFAWHCLIEGGGKIEIGDRVLIGPGAKILCSPYNHQGVYVSQALPDEAFSINTESIKIENDAYICAGAVVLPGVTIGDNVVIGAGSIVVKDIPSNCVAVGNPCKVIREITDEDKKTCWDR